MDSELKQELGVLKTQLEKHIDGKLAPLNEWKESKDKTDEKNQEVLDKIILERQRVPIKGEENKTFSSAFAQKIAEEFRNKQSDFRAFQNNKNVKLSFEMKDASTMMLATHLTGDPQATYNTRQGIIPNQKINFRDLIPTVPSTTGMYVTYRETGAQGEVGIQTEGELKNQLDYSFTEIKNVSHYVAGWVTFSKQLLLNLPWLQTTLSRLLLRDFYKKENAYFYSIVAANATGFDTTSEMTNDALGLIDILMGRADADYSNSFILVKNSQKGEILKQLYDSGNYLGAGSVIGMPDGTIRIADTPVIGASFATAGKIMIIDYDFIERVETEGLRIEFSYENEDNFKRNLVTARIECFEDLNLLRPDAHSYIDAPTSFATSPS